MNPEERTAGKRGFGENWQAGPAVRRLQTEQGIRQVTGRGTKSQKVQTPTEQHRAQRDDPAGTGDWSGADVASSDELMMTR